MVAKEGGKTASGKYLGINNSWASLGSIFWPLMSGVLYAKNIQYPFFGSAVVFCVIALFTWNFLRLHEEKAH
jgi:MFS family permease